MFDEDAFLHILEKNTFIYNKHDKRHADSLLINSAWEKVARGSGLRSVAEAKAKFMYLKQFYRKKQESVPPHPIIDKMRFLDPFLSRRRPRVKLSSSQSQIQTSELNLADHSDDTGSTICDTEMSDTTWSPVPPQTITSTSSAVPQTIKVESPPTWSGGETTLPGKRPRQSEDILEGAFASIMEIMERIASGPASPAAIGVDDAYAACISAVFREEIRKKQTQVEKLNFFNRIMNVIAQEF